MRIEFEEDDLIATKNVSAHDDSMILLTHRQRLAQAFALVVGFICVVSGIFTCNYYNIEKRVENSKYIKEYRGIFSRVAENSRDQCLFYGNRDIDAEGWFTRIIAIVCLTTSIGLIIMSISPIKKKIGSSLVMVIRNQYLNVFVIALSLNIINLISLTLLMSRSEIGCAGILEVDSECNMGFGYLMMMLSVIIYFIVLFLHFLISWEVENDSLTKITFEDDNSDEEEMRDSSFKRSLVRASNTIRANIVSAKSDYDKFYASRKSTLPRQNIQVNERSTPFGEEHFLSKKIQKTQNHPDGSQSIVNFEIVRSNTVVEEEKEEEKEEAEEEDSDGVEKDDEGKLGSSSSSTSSSDSYSRARSRVADTVAHFNDIPHM